MNDVLKQSLLKRGKSVIKTQCDLDKSRLSLFMDVSLQLMSWHGFISLDVPTLNNERPLLAVTNISCLSLQFTVVRSLKTNYLNE